MTRKMWYDIIIVTAIRQRVTVQPGGTIEVQSDELQPGAMAEVIVLVEAKIAPNPTLSSFIGAGKGCYSSVEEVDAFIRSERDAWDL